MPWMAATAAIGAGAGLISQAIGSKKQSLPSLPAFQNDPLVGQADSSLFNFGSDVLKGILPNSYQNLLQFDSPQFESVLKNSNRDVESAGLETAARQGNARSGAAQAGISSAVANNSSNLRYGDYLNTIANEKSILGTGLDSISSAGNMALANQGQENSYQLGGYSALLGGTVNMSALSQKSQAATGNSIGSALGSVIGALPYLSNVMGGASSGAGANISGGSTGILGALGSDSTSGGNPSTPGINAILNTISQGGDVSALFNP